MVLNLRMHLLHKLEQLTEMTEFKFKSVKTIDWEHFIMNILAHNLVIQMRMLKKAKEKKASATPPSISASPSNTLLNKMNAGTPNTASPISPITTSNSSQSAAATTNMNMNSSYNMTPVSAAYANKMLAAQSIAALNEANLIETFYELEAEIEKGICRDNITYNSTDIEHGTYRTQFFF